MADKADIRPAEKISLQAGWTVHKGQVRQNNEDSAAAVDVVLADGDEQQSVGVYAVADGMGGREGGEVASSLAVHTTVQRIVEAITTSVEPEPDDFRDWLRDAVEAADRTVQDEGGEMGTTLLAAIIVEQRAYLAHVGDSRAYILTGSGMEQLTEDQNYVQALLKAGAIEPHQVENHPYRNVLRQAVGKADDLEIELYETDLHPQDTLMLCTDGLTRELDDAAIERIVRQSESPQEACDALVAAANARGGRDNISVILVRIQPRQDGQSSHA
jgi:protein phosphatase